jgi:long-chain fatty acid transport protein
VRLKRLAGGLAGGALVGALTAHGAGLWLYERGTAENMTAVAGRAASALDASTAVSNPAGMTRLEQNELVLGLQPIYMDFQFDPDESTSVAGDDGGQAGGLTPAGGFYMVHPLTDRLRLGFGNFSAYGAAMDFGDSFVGRYTIMNAKLLTLTLGPSLGYRVNDWLSVGAGVYLTYATLDQEIAVPKLEAGDGTVTLKDEALGYCGSLGLLVEPRKGTRVGVAYTTETKLKFEDVLSARGLGPGQEWLLGRLGLSGGKMDLDMTMPQGVMTSVYQDLNDRWAVMGNLGWQDSSEAGQMDVDIDTPAKSIDTTMDRNFHDTYHMALGARCHLNPKWTWGFGVAYDTSPVDDEDRTVDMPLDRQWRYATGLQYAISETKTITVSYTFVDLGDAPVEQTYATGQRLAGEFEHNYLHIVALTWGLKF